METIIAPEGVSDINEAFAKEGIEKKASTFPVLLKKQYTDQPMLESQSPTKRKLNFSPSRSSVPPSTMDIPAVGPERSSAIVEQLSPMQMQAVAGESKGSFVVAASTSPVSSNAKPATEANRPETYKERYDRLFTRYVLISGTTRFG